MARILGVGIATVDIVATVGRYPAEDDEVRARALRVSRGGNATNTLVALSQLGHECAWLGVLPDGPGRQTIADDLARHRIDTRSCPVAPGVGAPTSCIWVSEANGSRTIVHHRDLRELSFEDFRRVDLARYEWVHFEGRAVDETVLMLEHLHRVRPAVACSVEVEKPRPGIERLFPLADLLLFSRAYARARGVPDPETLLWSVREAAPGATLACAWGEDGAAALSPEGESVASPAFPPPAVVDTLAAGDVFNAAFIDGMLRGAPLARVVEAACRVAGEKCGRHGLDGVGPARDTGSG